MVRRNQKSSLTYWRSTTENVFKKTGNKISGSKDKDEFEKDSTLWLSTNKTMLKLWFSD